MWKSIFIQDTDNPNIGTITSTWTGIVNNIPASFSVSQRLDATDTKNRDSYIADLSKSLLVFTDMAPSNPEKEIKLEIESYININSNK